MNLKVNKKTGFRSVSPVVVLYRNGQPFYANSIKNGMKEITFNLPYGEYKVLAGKLIQLEKPLQYTLIKLPYPNRRLEFPNNVKFYWIDNPNKCTVDMSSKYVTKVYFDKSFKQLPFFVSIWVCGHEFGHYFFSGRGQESEINCDHFAANLMLMNGYNPKQIDAAIDMAISNGYHATRRKKLLYQNLVNNVKLK